MFRSEWKYFPQNLNNMAERLTMCTKKLMSNKLESCWLVYRQWHLKVNILLGRLLILIVAPIV